MVAYILRVFGLEMQTTGFGSDKPGAPSLWEFKLLILDLVIQTLGCLQWGLQLGGPPVWEFNLPILDLVNETLMVCSGRRQTEGLQSGSSNYRFRL